jgi:predicted enzyme related to lactoylglutathione lyase
MPERTSYEPGTFSWVDLSTTDLEAAKTFYAGLFGWDYDISETPMGPYVMALKDGKAVAGMGNQSDDQKEMGVPSFWNSYVSVASADASAARAAELGGTVLLPPMDAMDAGRVAFIAAPGGEVFGVWEPKNHIGAGLVNEHGSLGWNELATRDLETAKAFYTGLFGWTMHTGPNPSDVGEYTSIAVGDNMNGGALVMGEDWPADVPAYWAVYLYVDDIDVATTTAKDLGGQVMMPAMDIPEVGAIVVLQDPTGAVFTVMQPAPRPDES